MMHINYGIDAPKFVRNLFLFSFLFFGTAIIVPGPGKVVFSIALAAGFICLTEGALMLLYAKKGKFNHRDRMLNLINWTGNETVLDVGTGLGLLMIGAAKRLTSGKAIGIDIWNKDDLSENSSYKTYKNSELEKVTGKIEVQEGNILHTDFPDNGFDVVLSNLCLHNVGNTENRKTACREIHRILKKNGVAIISDIAHCSEYKAEFLRLGMSAQKIGTFCLDTFQPLTIIKAVKI